MTNNTLYRGRFAPSPSGELHFGSLIAAVASYLDAQANQGEWIIRIEDIDESRTVAGSASSILKTLENFGFQWQGEVIYQSQRKALYQDYLNHLTAKNLIYPCDCSRKSLTQVVENSYGLRVYPGTCREKPAISNQTRALRCKTAAQNCEFTDVIQGRYQVILDKDCGDFIVKRRDDYFAYLLVATIDDAEQAISHVVRGADLLNATPQQIYLQQQLKLNAVSYAHVPVAMHKTGQKLSKSHRSLAVNDKQSVKTLCDVMRFLNLSPPATLDNEDLDVFWSWAKNAWRIDKIPPQQQIIV